MSDHAYTEADLALFEDLQSAARAVGVTPCLIGAGAIRMGVDLGWEVRLGRRTDDWDFAVRVESWEHYGELSEHLEGEGGASSVTPSPIVFDTATAASWMLCPTAISSDPKGKSGGTTEA